MATETESVANRDPSSNTVNIRIEANVSTLYEGPITSGPRNITGVEGNELVTVPCNGQGAGSNPGKPPGNTPVDALDAVARLRGFTYNGSFDGEFNDFDIDRISFAEDWNNENFTYIQFWGLLVNYQIPQFGEGLTLSGCQQLLNPGDDVLWAMITVFPTGFIGAVPRNVSYLKLTPTSVTVKKDKGFTVTVTDGRGGNATEGASVAGVKTDAKGKANLYFSKPGFYQYKAHRTGDVRSNVMNVTVTD